MNFDIISSNSKGNCVILENRVAIDCGVPFKLLRNVAKFLQLVLLTHKHADHFNAATVRKLASERPALRWGVPKWLVERVVDCGVDSRVIDVMQMDRQVKWGEIRAMPFELFHDVPNCGYRIEINGKTAVYATDTSGIDHIDAKGYDLYLIEANYDVGELAERVKQKETDGEYVYESRVVKNHLSKQATDEWIFANATKKSRFVYLHEHED